jgi:multiple sugar transport system substrate-binding protein
MKRREFLISASAVAGLSALGVPRLARAQAAQTAVDAAKQFSGSEITIVWEAGLQSLDPLNFSGPKWKELTGILD